MKSRTRPTRRAEARPAASGSPRRETLAFVGRFAAGWVCALLLTALVPGIERSAISGTVACLYGVLRAASIHTTVAGSQIVVGPTRSEIAPDCTPLFATAVLWSAILAFPASPRWKLTGALVGAAALWLYNLGRILALIGAEVFCPAWYEFIHAVLWQTLTLVVVVGVFGLWLRLEPRPGGPSPGIQTLRGHGPPDSAAEPGLTEP